MQRREYVVEKAGATQEDGRGTTGLCVEGGDVGREKKSLGEVSRVWDVRGVVAVRWGGYAVL